MSGEDLGNLKAIIDWVQNRKAEIRLLIQSTNELDGMYLCWIPLRGQKQSIFSHGDEPYDRDIRRGCIIAWLRSAILRLSWLHLIRG